MSIILHNRDIRSHVSDREPASSLDFLCWCGASMSPFYTEGDLEGAESSFSPNVRSRRCSQAGRDVLKQSSAILRYTPRVIRTMRAQKSTRFAGMALDVLAHLQLSGLPAAQLYRSLEDAGELLVRKMSGSLSANCCRKLTVALYTFLHRRRPGGHASSVLTKRAQAAMISGRR
jgi:hypothetical protein